MMTLVTLLTFINYEIHCGIFHSVTSCPEVKHAQVTRVKRFAFTINCSAGLEGVDSTDIYNCVDGKWELYGQEVKPNCTFAKSNSSTIKPTIITNTLDGEYTNYR